MLLDHKDLLELLVFLETRYQVRNTIKTQTDMLHYIYVGNWKLKPGIMSYSTGNFSHVSQVSECVLFVFM